MRRIGRSSRVAVGIAATFFSMGVCAQQELRVGFVSTMTGSGAAIGQQIENGFKLGLEHRGWKKDGDLLGGVPMRVIYVDDQVKPEVGLKEVEKLLKQDRVHVVAGIIWANVFTAVARPVLEQKRILMGAVSGLAQYAGEQCDPMLISTSFQNDQNAEATGELATKQGVKSIVAMAPNYQAGREYVDAFERTYKGGKILDRVMYKLGQSDFQAEFARVRSLKPDAVLIFAPGAMGLSFMKQWRSAGMQQEFKLLSLYTVDNANLPSISDAAIGVMDTNHWSPDLPNPLNKRFVQEFAAKYGFPPSFFAVGGYDVASALEAGLKATKGNVDDLPALAAAIKKSTIVSPRGDLKYNVNGFLLQPYYVREVVKGADGKAMFRSREVITNRPDSYWQKCKLAGK
jgi:branched-chain amino acid transport system substrate-binding protein